MSWFFSHWLGGGGDGGGGGAGSRRGEMRGAGEALSSSSPPSSTSQIKMGDYDLRTCVSSSGGLLSGGTPQQHALVQLKCAIQALLKERCHPPFQPGGTLSSCISATPRAPDPGEGGSQGSREPTSGLEAAVGAPRTAGEGPARGGPPESGLRHQCVVEAPRSGVAGGVGTETAPLEGVSSVRTEEEDPTLCASRVLECEQDLGREEQERDERAREAAWRESRRVIGPWGEEDPAVAAVLEALEQCVFLGMRRKEFHGVLPFWKMVWTAATGCLQEAGRQASVHQQHKRSSFRDYYGGQHHSPAEEVSPELVGFHRVYEAVLASTAVNNVVGRARAWLRLSLNAQCLETSLRALMTQHKHLLQVFYDPSLSLLLCPEGSLILLALVSTLETFSFSLHLKPGLDREVAYPFIDWAGGGQGGRGAGTGGSLKRGKDKKAALALREKEQDGREGGREGGGPRSPFPMPASPQTMIQSLDGTKLEDEEEMKRMRQALQLNPMLSFNEHDRSGDGAEGLERLLDQVGQGLDRLRLTSKALRGWEGLGECGAKQEAWPSVPRGEARRLPASKDAEGPVKRLWGESLERLCADPGLSLHALLAPDMAVPAVLAEMIDQLLTEEGLRTRSLFDAEVPEAVTVLHILELANRGHRLPAVPQDVKSAATHFQAISVALMEFLDALPEPLLGWHLYDAVVQAVTRRDLIEDPGTRLRNLRLLLGEIPPSHKPLLCKITRMAQRLLQEPSNGLTSQVLAEAFAHGVVRTPYLPQALSSRLEISRLLQNKEEVIVTQILFEHRSDLFVDLDAEQERHSRKLELTWDNLLLLRRQLETDPTAEERGAEGDGEGPGEGGRESVKEELARAVASRLAGVEAALNRIRFVSASTDDWQQASASDLRRPARPAPGSPPSLAGSETSSTLSMAVGVRQDILDVLEAKTAEEVVRSEAEGLTPATIHSRLLLCGFPRGDLSDFRASGGGVLGVACLIYFFQHHPKEAALLTFKYARRSGFCFPRVVSRVVRMVMGVLHLAPPVRDEHLLLHLSQASWWPLLCEHEAVPSLVALSLLLLDYLARHEALRPHEEDIFVLEVKRQLTWVLKQGPPSLEAAWHLWLSVRLEKLRAFARAEKARVYHKQFPQELSALPSFPNSAPVPPTPPSEAVARLTSFAASPSSSPPASTDHPAPTPLAPAPSLAPPRLLGVPSGSSTILSSLPASQLLALEGALPPQHQDYAWRLVYSLAGNGASLTTFFKKAKDKEPTLLVLKDMQGGVFGGFATRAWSAKGESYYGDGESFVWSLVGEPGPKGLGEAPLRKYGWSTENSYFQLSTAKDGLAMGGGGSFALFVDPELLNGSSGPSETFFSSALHLPPSTALPTPIPNLQPTQSIPFSLPTHSRPAATPEDACFEVLDLELWSLEAEYMASVTSLTRAATSMLEGTAGKKGMAEEMEQAIEKVDRGHNW